MKHFAIAIDGPAGAGKSTVARAVAKALNAAYLDTGAMYRAVALYMLRQAISPDDQAAIARHVADANVTVRAIDGEQHVYLNGEDVSASIRENRISAATSAVSAVPAVRERMTALQRAAAETAFVVMDGRDIGTKVLPDAPLKIFLTASLEERTRRRFIELRAKGQSVDFVRLFNEIMLRDYNDSHRETAPLTPAADAIELDSTGMSQADVAARIVALARSRMAQERTDAHE